MTSPVLDPERYTVAWIAPLEIEARAARAMLDKLHNGRFPVNKGDDYIFLAGEMCGHNIVIATFPIGTNYGTGAAAALAAQVKKCFPNLWFGLLVGVAAGLPSPKNDIRLGDVLVGVGNSKTNGILAYDLGRVEENMFTLLKDGHALATTESVILSAIGKIKYNWPNESELFQDYFKKIEAVCHPDGTFEDPGTDKDRLLMGADEARQQERTRVWYGPIGSGDKLMKDAQSRDMYRDQYGLIGLEMEAAGTMNTIRAGVIRGVCDYGDKHKQKEWQPYAAAMAAAYAKAVLAEIPSKQNSKDALSGASKCDHQNAT
jgi:nucleoside phosphorylase